MGCGLVEGSWKGMKKYLEQEMLCPALKGRVSFHCEVYPRFGSSSALFSVSLDGERIKAFGLMYALARLEEQGKLEPGHYLWRIPLCERDEYEDFEFARLCGNTGRSRYKAPFPAIILWFGCSPPLTAA